MSGQDKIGGINSTSDRFLSEYQIKSYENLLKSHETSNAKNQFNQDLNKTIETEEKNEKTDEVKMLTSEEINKIIKQEKRDFMPHLNSHLILSEIAEYKKEAN